MPGKTAAPHEIPYAKQEDKPPSTEAATKPMAERVHARLNAIALSQLVVPAGSDGKLVIVKDGAAAYTAMKGDGTIGEDGTFQLGKEVVGGNELGPKAVGTTKVDDGAITHGKVAAANIDGAAGTPSMRTLGTGSEQAAAGNDSRLFATPLEGVAVSAPPPADRYLRVMIGGDNYAIHLTKVN